MMILFFSFRCRLSLASSSRTSIPEWEGLLRGKKSSTKYHTLVRPEVHGFPLSIPKEGLLEIGLFAEFSPDNLVEATTHVSLAGKEDWPKSIYNCMFRLQDIDRVGPIARYQFYNRTCTIHNATVRPVIQDKLEGPRFDGSDTRLVCKLFLRRSLISARTSTEILPRCGIDMPSDQQTGTSCRRKSSGATLFRHYCNEGQDFTCAVSPAQNSPC